MPWQPTYEFKVLTFYDDKYADGDSFWLEIQRSFRDKKDIKCRLLGFDTWEIRKPRGETDEAVITEHKHRGRLAKDFTINWLKTYTERDDCLVWVRTHDISEWDNFGRVLCEVFVDLPDDTTRTLVDDLRENGHEKGEL